MRKTKTSKVILMFVLGALSLGALFFLARTKVDEVSREASIKSETEQEAQQAAMSVGGQGSKSATETSAAVQAMVKKAEANEPLVTLTPEEQKQWQAFKEITASGNDNDPRVDKDLRHLSENMRAALIKEYQTFAPEKRNQRGLVVFLISREIASVQDLDFLRSVYDEAPCLSLENCQTRVQVDEHHAGTEQTTLTYPQLVGLYQLEKQIDANPKLLNDPNFKDRLIAAIQQAMKFQVPAIQKKAEELLARISR